MAENCLGNHTKLGKLYIFLHIFRTGGIDGTSTL